MEYQNIINLLGNTPNQPSKFRTKIGLKKMLTLAERMTTIAKLNLKLQCSSQVYVIIVMYTCL